MSGSYGISPLTARLVGYSMQYLMYAFLGLIKLFDFRIGILPKPASIGPARTVYIQSSRCTRIIAVHVYEPSNHDMTERRPLPVYVSFHGGAFVLPCHGTDAELCAYWASTLGCVVLDADYAKAPQNPHPAAIDDAVDVLDYIFSKPELYDPRRVAVGGFSAGANIAILAALREAKEGIVISAVIAWYPPTDLSKTRDECKSSSAVSEYMHRAARMCYLPIGTDRAHPSVSPLFEDSSLFPPLTLIVGEDDNLHEDSVLLHRKLVDCGMDCEMLSVPGANHAWERFVKENTPLWASRTSALKLVEERLRKAYGVP